MYEFAERNDHEDDSEFRVSYQHLRELKELEREEEAIEEWKASRID